MKELISKASAQCTAILQQHNSPPPAASSSTSPPADLPPLQDVRHDFIVLSQALGKESTSLSLACKPPVSLKAAQGTVVNITNLLLKLEVCLLACPLKGALAKEINWSGQELVESVQRLLEGSLEAHLAEPKQAKVLREVNLRLTGQVWEKVEQAGKISANELQAMRKEWKSVLGLLDDCLEEVKEMEEAVQEEEEEEEDEEDDNSDDFRTSHPLSPTERARVGASHMLLRLGRLLLHRLVTSTAPTDAPPGLSSPPFLVTAQRLVQELSASADEFAEGLEPPQEEVGEQAEEFARVGKELSNAISEAVGGEGGEPEIKWQTMWREQLKKARLKLESMVDAAE